MGTHRYRCPQGHEHDHLHIPHGGGKLHMAWDRAGNLIEREDSRACPPPDERLCECGEPAQRVPGGALFNLRSDATQTSGWHRPGWCDVDYRNGPDGAPARHLRGYDNATNPYDPKQPPRPVRQDQASA